MVNFPLVSNALSFFPLSTPIKLIFPAWLPVAMNLESGENATVHVSTADQTKEASLFSLLDLLLIIILNTDKKTGKKYNLSAVQLSLMSEKESHKLVITK